MSKFNVRNTQKTKTVNLAGGEAFSVDSKFELVSLLLTSFVKDQYYRSENDTLEKVSSIIDSIGDKKFVAKSAIYARNKFGMRSISHVVAGEIAARIKGEQWTKNFYDQVVHRVDDITEILAYYMKTHGKPIPNSLKKGLSLAFGKFDEYQISKYRGEGADLSLVDVVNLIHPKPANGNSIALKKLVNDELRARNTFQVELSAAGKKAENEEEKAELKKQAWSKLIKERKLGYFALLKNLRNIIEQSPETIPAAIKMLTDASLIKKSLVLPFRFVTAMKQLSEDGIKSKEVFLGVNEALEKSFVNIPKFDGDTLVVVDHSGSMDSVEHGNLTNFEIGALFGVALAKSNDSDFMYFGDDARYYAINPLDSTITLVRILNGLNEGSTEVGHGTNFHAIFETARKAYDRIIIFSDMQGWVGYEDPGSALTDYKNRTGANPKIYSFDLAGYGTLQFPQQNVFCLAGFSDKVFDIMKLLETDRKALVTEIEKVNL